MKKEEFTALGINEELASKAAEASKKELEDYVSKTELEATEQAKKQLEKDLKDRDKQLEDLKKSSGDNEALNQQIAALQADNKAAKEKYDADMKELKLAAAVKLAVAATAHDADLVAGLVDKSKLILSDDGKVSGLDEQVKTLKESKAFLFKEEASAKSAKKPGYTPKAGETAEAGWAKTVAEDLNKEGSKNPYADAWAAK